MIQKLEEIKNDIQSVGTIENVKLDSEIYFVGKL